MRLSNIALSLTAMNGSSSFARGSSLALDFLSGNNTLSPAITFSRTTNATLTNSAGLVANAPMNLLTFSEQFDNAAWNPTQVTVTANAATAPDGTTTADKVIATTVDTSHILYQGITPTTGVSYVFSYYAKAAEYTKAGIRIGGGGYVTTPLAVIDLTNGGILSQQGFTSLVVQSVGNGWYRITAAFIAATGLLPNIQPLSDTYSIVSSSFSYAGNGTSGIFIWGAQLELGSTATTYNPTTVKNLLGFTEHFDNAAWTKSNAFVQTNLLTYSQDFDNGSWVKGASTVSANSTTAPDGTTTADKLVENSASSGHSVFQTTSAVLGTTYTMSGYLKKGERNFGWLKFSDGATNWGRCFNLDTGQVGNVVSGFTAPTASTITDVGNGWFRCTITMTAGASGTGGQDIGVMAADGTRVYLGDGTSGIYVWGAQLVQGTSAGDYKATYAAAAAVGYTDIYGQPFAQKLVPAAGTNTGNISQAVAVGVAPYTFSFRVKAAEQSVISVVSNLTGIFRANIFNLTTQGVSPGVGWTAAITPDPAGNGWFICSCTATADVAAAKSFQISNNSTGWTGDGTSGIYIFGAQLSDSASVDPYVYQPVAAPSSVAYYGPRFDYDPVTLAPKGLLIEEQRTNLLLYSQNFVNGWAISNCSVVANSLASPSGDVNATTVTPSLGVSSYYSPAISISAATSYTSSIYVKRGTGTWLLFNAWAGSSNNGASAWVNLSTGALGTVSATAGYSVLSSSISNVGNGWSRVSLTWQATSSGAVYANVRLVDGDNQFSFATVAGQTFHIWGAQLEAGAFATSYIPTVASQVTRAADSASMIGNNFARWYSQSSGTFMVQGDTAKPTSLVATAQLITASDGTANNSHRIRYITAGIDAVTVVGGSTQVDTNEVGYTANVSAKVAYAYQVNDYGFTVNGGTVQTITSATVPVVNSLQLGGFVANATPLNGHLQRFAFYGRKLSSTEQQGITS